MDGHDFLKTIENMFSADQGKRFKKELHTAILEIKDAYEQENINIEDKEYTFPRTYIGASTIGDPCYRKTWYSWRWAKLPQENGKALRIFNRGHLEEARFIAMLRACGWGVVQAVAGKQIGFVDREHFRGSCDGILVVSQDDQYLLEFKTHNDNSFATLSARGVMNSKPKHYAQMQIYMYEMNLDKALYMAVNKNTDELYCEVIQRHPEIGEAYADNALVVAYYPQPPVRYSEDPKSYECAWCTYRDICHFGAPVFNSCRTCSNAEPAGTEQKPEAGWICKKSNCIMDKYAQIKGCDDYELRFCFRRGL